MAFDIGPMGDGGRLGARRLLALAAYLETVSEADYDHRAWRRQRPDGGWAMCALGHGVDALPDVIGLRWRTPQSADVVRLDGSGVTANVLELAAEVFEIKLEEAAAVFGIGLGTLAYGPRGAFGLRPAQAAAAIRALAIAKMGLVSVSTL